MKSDIQIDSASTVDLDAQRNERQLESKKSMFKSSAKKRIQLTFENVTIESLPLKKRCRRAEGAPRKIIDNVSGSMVPGQFTAIMGASGAGKTTLLNYLSGRDFSKNLIKRGTIRVNGTDKTQLRGFQTITAFVTQDDIMLQTMTVRECLEFAARLKLMGSEEQKAKRVNSVLQELKLEKCQYTKIGGPHVKGVSGGERKRASIGVEMITDPTLIFLDEPTTGLDTYTAHSVVETMRDLALSGRTVVSTIHQPNSEMFNNFDRLMLLAKGKIIYYNESRLAVDYFAGIGYKCPDYSNPADYFMSIMSIESIEPDESEQEGQQMQPVDQAQLQKQYGEKIVFFDQKYQESNLRNDHTFMHPKVEALTQADLNIARNPWFYQLRLLMRRNFQNQARLPQTYFTKVIVTICTAIFVILCFRNLTDPKDGFQNRRSALFYMVMTMAFNAVQGVILVFPDERPVFLKEVNNNFYSCSAYFFAKIFAEIPASALTPFIFGAICYFAIGLNTSHPYNFPLFGGIMIMVYFASSSYSFILSTLFADKQLCVTLTPLLIIPFMLFGGYFITPSQIPTWLIEFEYISFFRFGWQALMINEFQDDKNNCAINAQFRADHSDLCTQVEKEYEGLVTFGINVCCGALAAIYVGCSFISLCILKMLSRSFE